MSNSNDAPDLAKEEEAPAPPPQKVLELRDVTFRGRAENSMKFSRANLVVHEGELVTLHVDPSARTREVASMIQGLRPSNAGKVLFQGETWEGSDYDRHFAMRSRIGRVFEGQAWIENLNVDENVTLARRHHGFSFDSIRADLAFWLERLDIGALSRKRPSFLEPSLLQVHQWIRAFLGTPSLLILEHPTRLVSTAWLPKLVDAINLLRERGSAVLWFTNMPLMINGSLQPPRIDYQIIRDRIEQMTGDSPHE